MLSSQGNPIKYGKEILRLLEAVNKPKEVAVVHCSAHRLGQTDIIKGNIRGDRTDFLAVLFVTVAALVSERTFGIKVPEYTHKENKLAKFPNCVKTSEEWWKTPDGQCVVTP